MTNRGTLEFVHELLSGPAPQPGPICRFSEQLFVRVHHVAGEQLELFVRVVKGDGGQLLPQTTQSLNFTTILKEFQILLLQ